MGTYTIMEHRSLKRSHWGRLWKKLMSSTMPSSSGNGSGTSLATQESFTSQDSLSALLGDQRFRSSTLNLELDPVQRTSSSTQTVKTFGSPRPNTPTVMNLFSNGWPTPKSEEKDSLESLDLPKVSMSVTPPLSN